VGAQEQNNFRAPETEQKNGGYKMNFRVGDNLIPVPETVVGTMPDRFKAMEEIDEATWLEAIEETTDATAKTGLERTLRAVKSRVEQAESAAAGGTGGLTQSNQFTPGSGGAPAARGSTMSPEERAARRDQNQQKTKAKTERLASSLSSQEAKLSQHADKLQIFSNLRSLLAVYDGKAGIRGVVTTTNTKLRVRVFDTILPADREPIDGANTTNRGESLDPKLAKKLFDFSLEESNPGSLSGFVMLVPPGITAEHLSKLTNIQTATDVENINRGIPMDKRNGSGYVPIYVDKVVMLTLLVACKFQLCHVNATNTAIDRTKPTIFAVPRTNSTTNRVWFALKAADASNNVTKLACEGYLPLNTYNAATASTEMQLVSRLLLNNLFKACSNANPDLKIRNLSDAARAKLDRFEAEETIMLRGLNQTANKVPSYLNSGRKGAEDKTIRTVASSHLMLK
jgi:hypothetical protein